MRLLRTAAGGFINAEKIVRLADERGGADDSWIVILDDGKEVALVVSARRILQRTGADRARLAASSVGIDPGGGGRLRVRGLLLRGRLTATAQNCFWIHALTSRNII